MPKSSKPMCAKRSWVHFIPGTSSSWTTSAHIKTNTRSGAAPAVGRALRRERTGALPRPDRPWRWRKVVVRFHHPARRTRQRKRRRARHHRAGKAISFPTDAKLHASVIKTARRIAATAANLGLWLRNASACLYTILACLRSLLVSPPAITLKFQPEGF